MKDEAIKPLDLTIATVCLVRAVNELSMFRTSQRLRRLPPSRHTHIRINLHTLAPAVPFKILA